MKCYAALGAFFVLTACGNDTQDSAKATISDPFEVALDGAEGTSVESDAESLMTTLLSPAGGVGLASHAELIGSAISLSDLGDGAKALYFPRGCLAVTSDTSNAAKNEVTYRFDACAGPLGLSRITGTIEVTYQSPLSNVLEIDAVGKDLTIGRAHIDFSSHSTVTARAGARTMRHTAQVNGETPSGALLNRRVEKTLSWVVGEACLGVAGVSEGTVRNRDVKVEIETYRRCRRACPEAGGRLRMTSEQTSVDVLFDGTNKARVVAHDGSEKVLSLPCE